MIQKSNKKYLSIIYLNIFYRSKSNEISMPNEYKVDHSYDNQVRDDNDDLTINGQEKEFEKGLDDIDTIQQIQTDMSVPPGAAEMTQRNSVRSKRFGFLSKIP
jgi:hypothetical protein